MYVRSATCSCSVELYKLWFTLADFLPNWHFRGVFSISIIYLSRVLCLCVTIAERSAILLILIIKLTKKTRRRVWRGRDRDGETGKEQIMEWGCEETFHCWSQTWETCRFRVPPAVALLNYLSSGKRLADFFPNCDISRGFSIFYLP